MTRFCLALVALITLASAAYAQEAPTRSWPTRPVRIINTFAPGGAADVPARLAADHVSNAFGQPFFVETSAGAAAFRDFVVAETARWRPMLGETGLAAP